MNILILNWKDIKNPDVGGAEIIVFELAKKLIKEGHAVTWFCREYPSCLNEEWICGIRIIRKGGRLGVYLEALKYYLSLKNRFDKVIECINTLCWQTPLYVSRDKRIVYINQLAKEVFFYELPKPFCYAAYFFEKWQYLAYKNTNFICYAKSVRKDLESFGIKKEKIAIFSLGIDHKRYKPRIKSKNPLFVFVARLVKMKRADLCVRAMKSVCQKLPTAKLAIIGYGPETENIKKLINKLNLSQNVYLVDKNNLFFSKNVKDEKTKLLQKSWSLLLPSVKEGWGMVVTEAAACSTPSIVSNVTGLCDSVIDKKTGIILSKSPNETELAEAILLIAQNSSLRNQMSLDAFDWSKNFSWEKSYEEFRKLIV